MSKSKSKKAAKTYGLSESQGPVEFVAPDLPYRPRDPKQYNPPIGLIGCGGISQTHLRAYRNAGYQMVALCDLVRARAEKRRDEFYPQAAIFTDYRKLLRRSDIEVVDIATHPAERVSLIEDSLKRGKHVLSQKPFVLDLDTGERLVELAEKKGCRLAVNQNGQWAPHFSYIRQAIKHGLIGKVISAHFGVHWDHSWTAGTPFNDVHHLILYDFAIHWFDMVTQFMGGQPAKRVYASLTNAPGQKPKPPLLAQVLIEYAAAQSTLTFDAAVPCGSLDGTFVGGTEGTLCSSGPDLSSQQVTLTTKAGFSRPRLEGTWFPDGFHGTMAELLCAVEERREPSNSARENLNSLALCFAAMRSADTQQPQTPGQVRCAGAG